MGVAYYIICDPADDELATAVDGKLLAQAEPQLNAIAQSLGLPLLESFLGFSDDIAAEFDLDPELIEAEPNWQAPEQGIEWFEAVDAQLPNDLGGELDDIAELRAELDDFVTVLKQLRQRGSRWQLALDL